jgi:hypothetical protein
VWCFIAIFVVFVEKHRRDEWSALSQEQIGIKEVSFVPQTQFDVTRVHNVHAVVAKNKRVGDGAYAHVFFVRRLAAAVVAVASSPNPGGVRRGFFCGCSFVQHRFSECRCVLRGHRPDSERARQFRLRRRLGAN